MKFQVGDIVTNEYIIEGEVLAFRDNGKDMQVKIIRHAESIPTGELCWVKSRYFELLDSSCAINITAAELADILGVIGGV